jgi:catecholate siderophore receptor
MSRWFVSSRFAGSFCSVICLALTQDARAQEGKKEEQLPPIEVTSQSKKKTAKKKSAPSTSPAPVSAEPSVTADIPPDSSASSDADGGLSSGGVDGYRATRSSTGTKTDTPLLDIPQAISVITAERAKDQHAVDVNQALRYVPGVIVAQGEGNRDQIVIRGQNTTADFFVDGVRDDVQYFRDLHNADRLEVLKGPNAMIFGRGGGGGVVNRVTKKAGEDVREGTAWIGSFDSYRATADVGARVSNDFAVRLNGVYEDSGSFRDGVDLERYGINPTVFFRPEENTRVWLSYEYFHDERTADRGLPSLNTVPPGGVRRPYPGSIEAFYGNPDLSVSDFAGHNLTATVEHKFSEDLKIRNHTYYGDFDKFYQNIFASSPVNAGGTYSVQAYNNTLLRDTLVNQTDVTYEFDGGWYGHTIVVGTEFTHQNTHSFRFDGLFSGGGTTLTGVPANDPTVSVPISFTQAANNNKSDLTTSSAYIQDQFDITKYFQVIGGVRFDRFDLDATNQLNGDNFGRVDDVWSPRIGVVVKPFDQLSLYASYSKSFLPSTGDQFSSLNLSASELEPEEFRNHEIGFKWDIAPRLMFSAALYRLERDNTRFPDGVRPGFFLTSGSSETRGGEIELVGNVTDEWEIAGGYARTFGEITSPQGTGTSPITAIDAGTSLPNIPEDLFTLWNKYQFTPMFAAGIGVIHRSEMLTSLGSKNASGVYTPPTELPSFTRVDAALYVNLTKNLEAQLNVENLFDETYYVSSHTDNNISPGSPQAFYFGVTSRY